MGWGVFEPMLELTRFILHVWDIRTVFVGAPSLNIVQNSSCQLLGMAHCEYVHKHCCGSIFLLVSCLFRIVEFYCLAAPDLLEKRLEHFYLHMIRYKPTKSEDPVEEWPFLRVEAWVHTKSMIDVTWWAPAAFPICRSANRLVVFYLNSSKYNRFLHSKIIVHKKPLTAAQCSKSQSFQQHDGQRVKRMWHKLKRQIGPIVWPKILATFNRTVCYGCVW